MFYKMLTTLTALPSLLDKTGLSEPVVLVTGLSLPMSPRRLPLREPVTESVLAFMVSSPFFSELLLVTLFVAALPRRPPPSGAAAAMDARRVTRIVEKRILKAGLVGFEVEYRVW
jgi:hypothetical protein